MSLLHIHVVTHLSGVPARIKDKNHELVRSNVLFVCFVSNKGTARLFLVAFEAYVSFCENRKTVASAKRLPDERSALMRPVEITSEPAWSSQLAAPTRSSRKRTWGTHTQSIQAHLRSARWRLWAPSRCRIVGRTGFGLDAEFWLDPTWLGQFALKAMLTARQKKNAGPAK